MNDRQDKFAQLKEQNTNSLSDTDISSSDKVSSNITSLSLASIKDGDLEHPEIRARLQKEWENYKRNSNSSQTKASKILKMNQSAFSQYMRGPEKGGVRLNHSFVAKFAAMVGKTPEELGVTMQAKVGAVPLEIKYTLSGKALSGVIISSFMGIPSGSCFGIEVDIPDWILKRGDIIIVDPEADIHDGDNVVAVTTSGLRRGALVYCTRTEAWEVRCSIAGGVEVLPAGELGEVHREVGHYSPEPPTRVYKK